MTKERLTRPDIAEMDGSSALPRKSGELVFHDEWERRAFAIAVALAEQGKFEWREFQRQLIEAVADAERDDPQNPNCGYFESWLASLEAVLREKHLIGWDQ